MKFFQNRKLILVLILSLGLFLRLYRIDQLADFNFDQARNVIAERKLLLTKRPTLLGVEDRIGNISIYYGPIHFYVMAPALWVANFNPLGTYVWTAILGTLTILIVYLASKSLLGAVFYAIFPLAVAYNRLDWNPDLITFFSAFAVLFLVKHKFFLTGLFIALAIQEHTAAGGLIVVALGNLWFKKMLTRDNVLRLAAGLIAGLLPLMLFDLHYNFLYTRGYLNLLLVHPYKGFYPHYILWLVPVAAVMFKYLPKKIVGALLTISLLWTAWWLTITPTEIARNPATVEKISHLIVSDRKQFSGPFNVASFVDPETRATAYRYFLDVYGQTPLSFDDYNKSQYLYVVTYQGAEDILKTQTYEISSFSPKNAYFISRVYGENIYRLEK